MEQNLSDFIDVHDGACWVCGTGPSLHEVMGGAYTYFPSIGVNAIGMDYFDPDYLVVVDRVQPENRWDERPELLERASYIHNSKAKYAFSRFDNGYSHAIWIPIKLENLMDHDCDYSLNRGKMFSHATATITAISVAIWMGFKQIGLIGFDLVRHDLARHHMSIEDACVKIRDYCQKNGIVILNLSDVSIIEAFSKCSIDEFIDIDRERY